MRLLLVRHAEAAPGEPDDLRELTPKGERQARRLGDELAAQGVQPAVILTSPLTRARQTAEALGAVLGADVEIDERLAPGATPEALREAVEQRGETVVAVGHQPDVGRIASVLGRSPSVVDFPPAGLAVLELP
jgi:phosphohistidine phosphatase